MKSEIEDPAVVPVPEGVADGCIVGIGTSAGGLEALQVFFGNVPPRCPHSFVVVQHLSSDHKSLMADLLQKSTALSVQQATDGMKIEPGSVYLIPPKHNLEIDQGVLSLSDKPPGKELNLPIDIFFRSLAQVQESRAIGVVLTGTGSDGTRGVRAIKDVGGMTMVQDPNQAAFDGMPVSAINTGVIDYVLPVEDMPSEIQSFIDMPLELEGVSNSIEHDSELLALVISRVKSVTDLDFNLYKRPTLVRRIRRRMGITKCKTLDKYLKLLHDDGREVEVLARECLIGVTRFFRDEDAWETLTTQVLAPLVRARAANGSEEGIRIWSVGCSTGEEVYTVGILLLEEMARQGVELPVKIFGTDISEQFLAIASKGVYPESIVADVATDRLARYFVKRGTDYHVTAALRSTAIFSPHNVIRDPPFKDLDVVICRNMLIYLQRAAQLRAINSLHYALRLNGTMMLGPSEHIGDFKVSLRATDAKARLYQNQTPSRGFGFGVMSEPDPTSSVRPRQVTRPNPLGARSAEVLGEAITEGLGIAAVFVDDGFDILHAIGEIRLFAELPQEGFTSNLLKLLDRSLSAAVSTAVRKAKLEASEVVYRDVRLTREGEATKIDVMVRPFSLEGPDWRQCFAVIFVPGSDDEISVPVITLDHGVDAVGSRVVEMEQELKDTRESLQAAIEELETTNEELQASNEELMAANEELQSTNEELQSMNEELHTVNSEHQQKITDLAELNGDMDNLLRSTEIGTIFLDADMRIRKFTPVIQEQFNLRGSDVGRPLAHFASTFSSSDNDKLLSEAVNVLESGTTADVQIPSGHDRTELVKLAPFKNETGGTDGVVMSFVDVTELKQTQDQYARQSDMFQQVLDGAMAGYWEFRPASNDFYMSPSFKAMLGRSDDEIGNTLEGMRQLVHPDDLAMVDAELDRLLAVDEDGRPTGLAGDLYEMETRFHHVDGSVVWMWCRGNLVADDDGSMRATGCYVDVTELKLIEADLLRSNDELKQFAYLTSHDLQEPLRTVSNFVEVLEKRYSQNLDDAGRQYLGIVMQATHRMQNLIRGILDYSRIGREVAEEVVDVGSVIESVIDDLDSSIQEAGADIDVNPMPKVVGYESELRMLFSNLISNAIKFRRPDVPPVIKINVKRIDEACWRFSVIDNGIGIEREHRERIFEIFNRLHTKDEFEGAGIGLAHARKIVELHGGTISIESEYGAGSTVHFELALG